MSNIEKANRILRQTERRLAQFVGDAVSQSRYDEAVTLTMLTKAVAGLIDGTATNGSSKTEIETSDSLPSTSANKRRRRKARKRVSAKAGYPRFMAQGDSLIKIGWSKKSKAEYQHKAPWDVVYQVARSAAKAKANGSLVTFDDFTPLMDKDGNEVPNYQVYLSLAWFRDSGLVDQEGRNGYKIDGSRLTDAILEQKRKLLPVA